MKIGIISTVAGDYSWAGSEEMWKLFALEALSAGHSVAVSLQAAFAQSEELSEFRRRGGEVFPYQPLNWMQRRLAAQGWYSRFGGIRRWNPDVLCISGGPGDPYWRRDLLALLKVFDAPQVYIVQGNADGFIKGDEQREALRPLFESAARIVCVSRENALMLERQLAAQLPNIVLLPNPIRSRLDAPLPWPKEADGVVQFATVGRYDAETKCQDRTLEALATPEWKDRRWHLSLYGSGPDKLYLGQLIRHYGLEAHVTLAGFERDFSRIWARHHLHILNSRAEGLALALIESMFCGRPAVVTRTGGNHELVRDGVDGYVCPGTDPEIIRETLEGRPGRLWGIRRFNALPPGCRRISDSSCSTRSPARDRAAPLPRPAWRNRPRPQSVVERALCESPISIHQPRADRPC
jgi:glycosyltransferase involved in cell wall biosynthesis